MEVMNDRSKFNAYSPLPHHQTHISPFPHQNIPIYQNSFHAEINKGALNATACPSVCSIGNFQVRANGVSACPPRLIRTNFNANSMSPKKPIIQMKNEKLPSTAKSNSIFVGQTPQLSYVRPASAKIHHVSREALQFPIHSQRYIFAERNSFP
jgi:hypothetical protein